MQVTSCLELIPNIVLPTSLSQEQHQAYEEEITAHAISHPPSSLLPNKILVIRNLDDENFL